MAVEDVGAEQKSGNRQRGAGQHGEADMVIRVVHAQFAVEPFAFVERGAIHQVEGKLRRGLVNGDVILRRPKMYGQAIIDAPRVLEIDGGVARNHHRGFVAQRAKSGWERSDDVGQAPRFSERRSLRGNHQNASHRGM